MSNDDLEQRRKKNNLSISPLFPISMLVEKRHRSMITEKQDTHDPESGYPKGHGVLLHDAPPKKGITT